MNRVKRSVLTKVGTVAALIVMVAVMTSGGFAADVTQTDPRTMRFKPVEFNPPEPDRIVLDNGMVLYLLEDHELPLITVSAVMRTGSWLDQADKIGLASLTGTVMRTGGSARMSATQVDEELEQLAASLSISVGRESGSASLDFLKKDVKRGLQIFGDLLRTPVFDQSRVELAKLQAIEGIRRRQDSPGSIVSREFVKVLYGPTHPTGRESTVETVGRITREDLVSFHRRTVHPNGMILGVTGDFNKSEMLAT
ncbi:MAG: M16 family metallopeptidase, partial [Nitrospiraceae bacterium]